jgi:molecular chaperone GrpE
VKRHARGGDGMKDEGAPAGAAPAEDVTGPPAGDADAVVGPAAPPAEDAGDLRDRWLRAEADLQNYRRRAAREREEARRSAEEGVMLEIIAALDDLDRALGTARDSGAPESWTEGVRMVAARLGDFLARQGVTPVDPLGQPFDPSFHEGVLEMEAAGVPPGHVAQVVLRGWRRGDRALRAARVVVAREPGGAG